MPKSSKKKAKQTFQQRVLAMLKKPLTAIRRRVSGFLARRPHRSFRLTRRRDYARALELPGLIKFTHLVNTTVWRFRKVLALLVVTYAALTVVLVGIGSQDTYTSLTNSLRDAGQEVFGGDTNALLDAGLLFFSIASNGLRATLTEAQQIFAVIIALFIWLTTVWLLRNLMAGNNVRLRDGLYSAGAPIISLFLVGLVTVVQLLPIGVAALGYNAALGSGLLEGGIEAMLFWAAVAGLGLLSLYWLTSTFFAMVIVTLPGMYPLQALRTAGDLVQGRRIRLMIRVLWMVLTAVLSWAVILIPFILLDAWIKGIWPQIEWIPIIPVMLLIVTSLSVVWIATHVYILYRKLVDSGDIASSK